MVRMLYSLADSDAQTCRSDDFFPDEHDATLCASIDTLREGSQAL